MKMAGATRAVRVFGSVALELVGFRYEIKAPLFLILPVITANERA